MSQRILIVDDESKIRNILLHIMSDEGYTVKDVESGEKAIECVDSFNPELILMDQNMPGMDGLETYKRILELHPGQKAIITSGFSETDRVKKAQGMGAGQYIRKPYTLNKIGAAVKKELENLFEWRFNVKPQVILVKDNQNFKKMTRNDLFVAFVVADKNLIVIDYSRMNVRPFTLGVTLKHELCHLLLHSQISYSNLPRWLNEGFCQWISDGIGEIYLDKSNSALDAAIISGRIIPLDRLTDHFPGNKASLILAYEQSKSVITYIERQYGKGTITDILGHLKNGDSMETASMKSLSVTVGELEKEWLDQLERTPRWMIFLANNLYGILFFLAALLTFFGFIRLVMRKRAYKDWEDEDED